MDPVVAAALARRPAYAAGGRHGDPRAGGTESGLGWPGTSTTHEGLGWPGGTSNEVRPEPAPAAEPARKRRGWRRLFRAA